MMSETVKLPVVTCSRCGVEYPDPGPAPEICPSCDAYVDLPAQAETTNMATEYAFCAWHPERGLDLRKQSEFEDDVRWMLGSKAMEEGWKPAPVTVTYEVRR